MFVVVSQRPEFHLKWANILRNLGQVRHAESMAAGQLALRQKTPSLALIDAQLQDPIPAATIENLRQHCGEARLLLGDTAFEPLQELAALAAGAAACCDVELQCQDLERIVGIVRQGGVWVSQATIPLLVSRLQAFTSHSAAPAATPPDRLNGLTQRQREVAAMVGQGASNKQIARALDISDRTVKAHLTTIFEKLGTSDRLQLALYVTDRKPDASANATLPDALRRTP